MIGWVDCYCREWAKQRKALECSPQSGFSSIAGRIMAGWTIALAEGSRNQRVHAALTGDALRVHVAIQRAIEDRIMTEKQYWVLNAHYLLPGPGKKKCYLIGMKRRAYYDRLDLTHRILARYIDPEGAVRPHTRQWTPPALA